jgi:maltose alpha-D-glucosyltransferase/alpha-amylase
VLVYVRQYHGEAILCVANLSRSAQAVEIDLSEWRGRIPFEMLGRSQFPRVGTLPYLVTLAPYGFFWFNLQHEDEAPEEVSVKPEFVTLVVSDGWDSLTKGRSRGTLERDVLPAFLAARRWFAEKDSALRSVRLEAAIPLSGGDPGFILVLVDTVTDRGASRYLLPVTIKWGRFDRIDVNLAQVVSAVRRGPREGTLLDACGDITFTTMLLRRLHAGETIGAEGRRVEFRPTERFRAMPAPSVESVRTVDREQSNTTVIVDSAFVMKFLRRVSPGTHPEAEIGRFLTDVAGYQNTPPLLGSIEYMDSAAGTALAVIHGFVENQGDAWSVTNAYLDRFIDEQRLLPAQQPAESTERAAYVHRMRQIGRRTAELHDALASRTDIPEFAPEPIASDDIRRWTDALLARAEKTLDGVAQRREQLTGTNRSAADGLLARRDEALAELRSWVPDQVDAIRIRHHGDFHLGQMLFAKDDVFIIDFEGEPQRSLDERRRKAPAARDVAGLIRSIDYSATGAFDRAVHAQPDEHGRLLLALEGWREAAVQAFISSYRDALANPQLWPADPLVAERLLKFFILEKAFYEIDYELANRPTWLHIPLAGTYRTLFSDEGPR